MPRCLGLSGCPLSSSVIPASQGKRRTWSPEKDLDPFHSFFSHSVIWLIVVGGHSAWVGDVGMTERHRHCPNKPFGPLWYPEHQKSNHNVALSNPNYNEVSLHTHQYGYYKKKTQTNQTSVGKGVQQLEHCVLLVRM